MVTEIDCERSFSYGTRSLRSVLEWRGSIYGIHRSSFILVFILVQGLVPFGHWKRKSIVKTHSVFKKRMVIAPTKLL